MCRQQPPSRQIYDHEKGPQGDEQMVEVQRGNRSGAEVDELR